MQIVSGGVVPQAQIALRHVDRVIKSIAAPFSLRNAMLVVCYLVIPDHRSLIEDVFKEYFVRIHKIYKPSCYEFCESMTFLHRFLLMVSS